MPRFFVDAEQVGPQSAVLTGEQAGHAKVLRLKCGDAVILCDGQGTDYHCVISDISPELVCLTVERQCRAESEAQVFVSVYMGYAKGDKFEHVIQKATELGAGEIIGFPSSRCVAKLDEKTLAKKLPRWQKIAAAAAEQSGRGRIPQVLALSSYESALQRAASAEKALFFYENENHAHPLRCLGRRISDHIADDRARGRLCPPGGRTGQKVGLEICSLGRRILRCETAPLCALSAVMSRRESFRPDRNGVYL